MKKTLLLSFLAIGLFLVSCKNDNANDSEAKVEETKMEEKAFVKTGKNAYTVIPESVNLKWVAYKTTDKVPVGGSFNELKIENIHRGNNITEAMNGLTFTIPVSSLFTDNKERDEKLKTSFFGKMTDTQVITGKIVAKTITSAYALIKMNGIEVKIPIRYGNTGNIISLMATLDLKSWDALPAVAALNEVCKDLHKGKDGVSKTWDEININITGKLLID